MYNKFCGNPISEDNEVTAIVNRIINLITFLAEILKVIIISPPYQKFIKNHYKNQYLLLIFLDF